ncbi:helix-turn-helix transcriptional regulator [Caulobacter sp. FWC2]|uniref:helix-turn-helix domain-containing protein n=1 Tax=Caulobacter sp. FWC2 TaxID=69664 RepID=UPI000C1529EA|nr:helix-turn-helix transcriptional regulator [Caulobacter sp. FWC2]PIB90474.1 DNA-binding protein [Caulobacter sp. FWC2]
MALFFDAAWYDGRLAERGLSRTMLAAAAGLSEVELALAFKDQRELSMREVSVFAELLGVAPAEAASRAGVRPPPASDAQRLTSLEARVAALEAELTRLKG